MIPDIDIQIMNVDSSVLKIFGNILSISELLSDNPRGSDIVGAYPCLTVPIMMGSWDCVRVHSTVMLQRS